MSFYQRIQELAQKKGVSFKQIEKEMSYPTNTLYGYKSKVPGGQRLVELSQYFDVSIDYLMCRKAKDTTEEFEELFKMIYRDFILAIRECNFKRMDFVANLSFFGEIADLIHNFDVVNNKGYLITELWQYSYYLEKNINCKKDLPDFIIDMYKRQYKTLDTFLNNH